MAVQYVPFDGGNVSMRWRRVLRVARKDGVSFFVNSGHRTIKEQWKKFRQNMRWNGVRWVQRVTASGLLRPLTAYPTPNAPHVLTGRHAHALDADNAIALVRWLQKQGVQAGLPVPGENWHIQVSGRDLSRLSRRLG